MEVGSRSITHRSNSRRTPRDAFGGVLFACELRVQDTGRRRYSAVTHPQMLRALTHLVPTMLCLAGAPAAQSARSPESTALPRELAATELELEARWERLTDTVYHFEERFELVADLAPAARRRTCDAARLSALLPAQAVAVGDVWPVDVESLLPFVRQLHAGATATLHHDRGSGIGAPGAFACLRAIDGAHAEIVLRAHVDFRIAGDGTDARSSWFTPAQFAGRIALDLARRTVLGFELAVPDQHSNVDVNVALEQGVIADIGRVPEMSIRGGTFPAFAEDAAQIAERAARERLTRAFYPFAAIAWHELAEARALSLATHKPLHVIALFGSLLDESC
ncbi:MAG: hypothetical protein KDE27_15755 [Planctomycetes bacterium]|nr:hypothetical protein [Planctomycetota bacterium]